MKHKHCEVIKAYADGAVIQVKGAGTEWEDCVMPCFTGWNEYRVKPQDITKTMRCAIMSQGLYYVSHDAVYPNIRIIFDGETGLPKKVELLGEA